VAVLTSPAVNATLADIVTLTADASDNSAVAGVQFQLDGVSLGREDLEGPYQTTWDTRTAANGPHAIVAVARDASGNVSTATPVPVTVYNPLPGSIQVTVTTTGPLAAGRRYVVHLDGGARGSVDANGSLALATVAAGLHTVDLTSAWPFCAATGERPRQVQVPAGGTAAVTIEAACVAGPAGRIAYTAQVAAELLPNVYVLTPGDGSISLVAEPGHGPAWSPDGTQLVFLRSIESTDRSDLYRVQADGSGTVFLSTLPARPVGLDWSVGGTIVFRAMRALANGDLVHDLYFIDSDGTDLRPLFAEAAPRDLPSLSPDGAEVAFSLETSPGALELWVARIDGSSPRRLTSGFADGEADWSPDGTRIAFQRRGVNDAFGSIMVIGADGSGLVNVTSWALRAGGPSWSPDGEWIAADIQRSIAGVLMDGVWLMRADGTSPVEVVPDGGGPRWAP
jgi:Tol biopolymer transport system component